MCSVNLQKKVLGVLADNIAGNSSPDLVASATIASRLNISPVEIRSALLTMSDAGIIESDPDTERVLITHRGMCWLHDAVAG